MPRADRRFTGEDLKRLYCKNLTPKERYFFDILDCDWSDKSVQEKARDIFKALKESGLLDDALEYLPNGNYIKKALQVVYFLLDEGALGEIDFIPALDWKETLDELFNINERYQELEGKYELLLLK